MDKTTQDLAWQCLPLEAKKEVKQAFCLPTENDYEQGYDNALVSLFGIHNLTSEAEGENVNLSQSSSNCDKEFDNILRDSFSKERRLNMATRIMSGLLSNQEALSNLAYGETTTEGVVKCIVNATMMYTDALITECEKGGEE